MKSFEHYKNNFFRVAEGGLSDYRAGDESKIDLLKKIIEKESSKGEILLSIFKLIKDFLPKNETTNKAFLDLFQNPDHLPFDIEKLSYEGKIGKGGQCDAFLLSSRIPELPSYVFKVQNFVTPEMKSDTIEDTAKNLKEEYEYIKDIYKDLPEVIPVEFTIILENPKNFNKGPRVAFVQRFYGTDIKDFFTELSAEEIFSMCQTDKDFFTNVQKFIEITLKYYREKGIVVDLFGPKNLAVVSNKGCPALVLLDPHVTYSILDGESRIPSSRMNKAISYLTSIQDKIRIISHHTND